MGNGPNFRLLNCCSSLHICIYIYISNSKVCVCFSSHTRFDYLGKRNVGPKNITGMYVPQ